MSIAILKAVLQTKLPQTIMKHCCKNLFLKKESYLGLCQAAMTELSCEKKVNPNLRGLFRGSF